MESENELHRGLRDLYWRRKEDYGCNADRFVQKLGRDGAVITARDLILAKGLSQGFKELRARNLLYLTVETTVLGDQLRQLFSAQVADAARRKLAVAGYQFTG
jgi:hypothetical protein